MFLTNPVARCCMIFIEAVCAIFVCGFLLTLLCMLTALWIL